MTMPVTPKAIQRKCRRWELAGLVVPADPEDDFLDGCREPVAVSRNSHDVSRLLRCVPERPADQEDLLRQVSFFDNDIGPDGPEQFVLRDHAIAVVDQDDQRIERFDIKGTGVRR